MPEDLFVPTTSTDDAVVGPLHTVTYVTRDRETVERIFVEGYGLTSSDWWQPANSDRAVLNPYLGFDPTHTWEACCFAKSGAGRNVQIRTIHIEQDTPVVRDAYEGLYAGGATISFPIADLRAHEKVMANLGVESTIGVKEMEFTSPAGETYVSAEIVYKAPENVFVMGVTRPDVFVPVGPMDPDTGIGGPAYSARCITATDKVLTFLTEVLGYEVRRDMTLALGDGPSAINLPPGVEERFIQAFAPGASTGYLVFMDHGDATKFGSAGTYGPPSRGFAMWSFPTADIDAVADRAASAGVKILAKPGAIDSPFLSATRTLLLEDPDGFPIEIFETA